MKKITYNEFGITSEIISYTKLGAKLKGMRDRKPFVQNKEIFINIDEYLYKVDKIKFYDSNRNEISRETVCLDTNLRIAGIIKNDKGEVLLVQKFGERKFFFFPGGHQRECESIKDCLVREMKEETGIDITLCKSSLFLKMHEKGFGPEEFYIIELENEEIIFESIDLDLTKERLVITNISELKDIENLFPEEVKIKLLNDYE